MNLEGPGFTQCAQAAPPVCAETKKMYFTSCWTSEILEIDVHGADPKVQVKGPYGKCTYGCVALASNGCFYAPPRTKGTGKSSNICLEINPATGAVNQISCPT